MSQRGLKFAALRSQISPTVTNIPHILKNNSEKAQKTLDNPLTWWYTVYVDSGQRERT